MRLIHTLLAILALVSVALLPGPSHALAAASAGHHGHSHAAFQHGHVAVAGRDTPPQKPSKSCPCKSCSVACCAPATADAAQPSVAIDVAAIRLRPSPPETDRPLADALQRTPLKPPTAA